MIRYTRLQLFYTTACLLLLAACSGSSADYMLKVKLHKLHQDDIYNSDLVYNVVFDAGELNLDSLKGKSRKLFLKGVDAYKNKKNPRYAADLFKRSILVFPDAKTYYELGNALLETRQLDESQKAYNIARRLNFQPASSIDYKVACIYYNRYLVAHALNKDKEYALNDAVNILADVFINGPVDTIAVAKDPELRGITTTAAYQSMLIRVLANKSSGEENTLFGLYKRSFVPEQVVETTPESVNMGRYQESISYDFAKYIPEMENTSFGREVSHDYFYVAKVAETPEYTAVIYSATAFAGEEMQPVYTTLAVYDQSGAVRSSKRIGCQCSAERIKTFKVEGDKVLVQEYKRIWEQPIDKVAFEDNKVKEYQPLAKATFRIDASGMIVDEEVPAAFNDSMTVAKQ